MKERQWRNGREEINETRAKEIRERPGEEIEEIEVRKETRAKEIKEKKTERRNKRIWSKKGNEGKRSERKTE